MKTALFPHAARAVTCGWQAVGMLALGLLLVCGPAAAATDPVIPANGGFESGLTGWGSTGNVVVQTAPPYVPAEGKKLAAFNAGNSQPNGVLSRAFDSIPGRVYLVSFQIGVLAYNTSWQRMQVEVASSPAPLARTFTITGTGGGRVRWMKVEFEFTAGLNRSTLTFRDTSTNTSSIDLLLDSVRVTPRIVRTLTVDSSGPVFHEVPVSVSPADENGNADGETVFVRSYRDGSVVDLQAPLVFRAFFAPGIALDYHFLKWQRNGTDAGTTPSVRITMNGDVTMNAVYQPTPPSITSQPLDAIAGVGGSATFHVAVEAEGPRVFQWYRNGTAISGAIADTLTVGNLTAADDGAEFHVRVTAPGGSVDSDSALLSVVTRSFANGGFESGFDGWTATGNVRTQPVPSGTEPGGSRIVGFNAGDTPPNGVLSQSFATVPGVAYDLSFDTGVLSYIAGEQRMQIDAVGNFQLISELLTITGQGGGEVRWQSKRLPFIADSTATTITFRDVSPVTRSIDLLLDHVRVDPAPDEFALIPAGTFIMGSPVDEPGRYNGEIQHQVTLTRAYLLKRTEVTTADWNVVSGHAAEYGYTDLRPGLLDPGSDYPVEGVSWYDAIRWCNLRSELEGRTPVYHTTPACGPADVLRTGKSEPFVDWNADGYRLPTEAEWEYACRAGTTTAFHTGPITSPLGFDPNLDLAGWYANNSGGNSHPVTQKAANDWGLWDMHGNVGEWCWDYPEDYTSAARTDPHGPDLTGARIFRGGGAHYYAFSCRSAFRTYVSGPYFGVLHVGFRPARNVPVSEFVSIPAGSFWMGNQAGTPVGYDDELPLHSVTLGAYQIGRFEVNKSLWDGVRTWALGHGYTDLAAGSGKGPSHPVHTITWYDMVKWCNARSEMENLPPCYLLAGEIYRVGRGNPVCDWNASGYRLPTEAEWENAARGGFSGRSFPWGNAINQRLSNFSLHPLWGNQDDRNYPYTSPVGSFAPNGYGLHDVTGNVFEWCWDWYGSYSASAQLDPHGPATGLYRILRGGSWADGETYCRLSMRYGYASGAGAPSYAENLYGFRLARNGTP